MSAYTSLYNIDMNLAEKLIEFTGYPTADEQLEYEGITMKFLVEGNMKEFIAKILERLDAVVEKSGDEEVESFIQAIISVLYTSNAAEEKDVTVNAITLVLSKLTGNKSSSKRRLKAILALLNIVLEIEIKYNILVALLDYAMSTENVKYISHFHQRIDGWIKSWNLSTLQQRTLYQKISEILSIENKPSLSLISLIKYFDTFAGEIYPSEVEAIAKNAVLSAIKSPVSSFPDRTALLESFRKQNLSGDLAKLVQLLEIICTGKLPAFKTFETSSKNFLTQYKIDTATVYYNIRMMTLCALGCDKSNVTYKEVAAALEVSADEVEEWIVDAVGQGLMTAQMDQTNQSVCITRSAHRSFDIEQWKSLQEKLRALRSRVATVLETVKTNPKM